MYRFRIMGKPIAKQSVKFARIGNFTKTYTPTEMVNYANWVKTSFYKKYPKALPSELINKQLKISIDVYFAMPKSFSKKKQELAEQGVLRPTVKPDWDNISKNICDSLNGIAYPDDKAIVSGSVNKYYATFDYVEVCIDEI